MRKVLRITLFNMKYKIYTDGACSGNPGPGGWAAIILVDNKIKEEISGSEKNTTNNKMELLAPIRAIQKFKKKSEILIGKYSININSREILFDNKVLKLTEKEINNKIR